MNINPNLLCINCFSDKIKIKRNSLYCNNCKSNFFIENSIIFNKKHRNKFFNYYKRLKKINSKELIYDFEKSKQSLRYWKKREKFGYQFYHIFHRLLPKRKLIFLDFAGGLGLISKVFIEKNKKNHRVIIDKNLSPLIRGARILKDNSKFININYQNRLPFQNNSFDIVIATNSIYYIKNKTKFLSEIYRVLKQNGILIFNFFRKELPKNHLIPTLPFFWYLPFFIKKIYLNLYLLIKYQERQYKKGYIRNSKMSYPISFHDCKRLMKHSKFSKYDIGFIKNKNFLKFRTIKDRFKEKYLFCISYKNKKEI
jgi:ubiquinone/menaquinone biosynthesis C-methylase UbiE